MSGIANNSLQEFQARVARFDQKYVTDWEAWLRAPAELIPSKFGSVLRKWQACRPNSMRRTKAENLHESPFLEDLIEQAKPHISDLSEFNLRSADSFTQSASSALSSLWNIFQHLSYGERARNGLAGAVGISKAVLLLSNGRVGPAFDSKVSQHLKVEITDAESWVRALRRACDDIRAFEAKNATTVALAVPQFAHLHSGRIYDMALGPGG